MRRRSSHPPESRDRAGRPMLESKADYASEFEAIRAIAAKLGIRSAESLRKWIRPVGINGGVWPGGVTVEHEQIEAFKKSVPELRRTNQILKETASFLGTELDRQRLF